MSELKQKLNQLHKQGIFQETADQRIEEIKVIEKEIITLKKDKQLDKLMKLFKALGNKNRLLILALIMKGVRCACEIEHLLNLSQSTVSHHISTLVDVGALDAIKSGKWNLVKLDETSFSKEFFISLINSSFE
ncbi:MAG: winged helix-turn-helix transcriptional regulator [Candidatus Heimdallarchaeota archaeon]|nr:winged helix-turn-helix transcriptional regulator [Candidatus Heimdallarchaeota archaeon]MCK4878021.1 winged helix-turn-helix transcriptional regulator [Candidatus Heimdallarchaeota archaeon]